MIAVGAADWCRLEFNGLNSSIGKTSRMRRKAGELPSFRVGDVGGQA